MRAVLIAAVVLGVGALPVHAQTRGEMTVEQLVEFAATNNPELRAARSDVEAASARVRQAGLRPNPMLDLGGQKAIGPDNNLNVGLTVPLDLNGRKEGRVGVAEQELAVKRAQLADRERRLRADVLMKAGELLAARRTLAVADDLLRANRESLSLVEQRVRQGAAPRLDEGLIRVEVNRLEASRVVLASRLDVVSLQLRALAGMSVDAPFGVRGDLSSPPTVPAPAQLNATLAERPDVRAARSEIDVARAKVRKEQAEGRWDASVNVGYQRQDFGFDLRGLTASGSTRPIQDVFHYFGAGVSVTLPVRNRNEGNVAAATAEAMAAERRHEYAQLIAHQEVSAALAQREATVRALELYERGVRDIARANLNVVRESYALGRATLLDVITEQRRYIEIEAGFTDVLRQAWDAAVDVGRALGGSQPGARRATEAQHAAR
jgi:cobalt-zinc-cadmium efflux system outer membrane protein